MILWGVYRGEELISVHFTELGAEQNRKAYGIGYYVDKVVIHD